MFTPLSGSNDQFPHLLAEKILKNKFFNICDVGCGGGVATRELLQALVEMPFIKKNGIQIKIHGLDISQQQIETALKNSNDPRLSFETLDAEKMQAKDQYDLVISLFTLHWIKDLDKVTANIFNALRSKGHFMCFSPLEKPELIQLRENFLKNPKWQSYFKNFKLEPFRVTSQEYIRSFATHFTIEDHNHIRGQTTKNYTEDEFITFLMSWLPEVRHLETQENVKNLAKEYVTELVQTIRPSYFRYGHLSREEKKDGGIMIQFIEQYHWLFAERLDHPLEKDNTLRTAPDMTAQQRDIYRGLFLGGHQSPETIDQYPLDSEFKIPELS